MPRGVPASGKRRSSTEPAATAAESTLPLGPFDDALDDDGTAAIEEDPTPQLEPAGDDLIEVLADPVIAQPMPVPYQSSSVPDAQLTAEQREIKALRDQLARERGKKDAEPQVDELARPGDEGNILIHFLEDGLTVLGKVMYRGDELEFDTTGQAYKDTFNRLGQTWLDLRHDEFGQVDRWGKIMFRKGPWPGKTYKDGTFEALRGEKEGSSVRPPTAEELEAAEKLRKRRAAPRLPAQL